MKKHVAIYHRVSSDQQDLKSHAPELRRFARKQKLPVVWYTEKFTGKPMDRPGWNKLMDAVSAAKVARIAVWQLDRLGRSVNGLMALFETLMKHNVGLISIEESIDLNRTNWAPMARMAASMAQCETHVRAEGILAGQAAARAQGKRWGGSKTGRRVKVTNETLATIKRMKIKKSSIAAIARATGLSRQTVYRYV